MTGNPKDSISVMSGMSQVNCSDCNKNILDNQVGQCLRLQLSEALP